MALAVVNQYRDDNGRTHLIEKRQFRCNCMFSGYCPGDLNYDGACGCMVCNDGAPLPATAAPRTTTTTTINNARCNAICVSRRRVPHANCPSCLSGAKHYGNNYYCCGGNMAHSCAGRFTSSGDACACRGTSTTVTNDCIIYDSGCGYLGNVDFDSTCGCFYCAK